MDFVSRAAWGSENTHPPQSPAAKPEVFIHHVAGRTPTSTADEVAHMHELQRRAIDVKHYTDMDYNAAVGPSGTAYEGRGLFAMSAATLDRNAVSRAIVLMGNLDLKEPTEAQLDTLPKLIVHLIGIGALRRDVTILGHYENPEHPGATVCPGRFMKPHLPAVRAAVAELLDPSEEDEMIEPKLVRPKGWANEFLYCESTGSFTHGGDADKEPTKTWRVRYGVPDNLGHKIAEVWEHEVDIMAKGMFVKAGLDMDVDGRPSNPPGS